MSLPRPPSIFDGGDLRAAFARGGAPTAHNLGSPESEALRELIVGMEARIRQLAEHEVFTRAHVACCPAPRVAAEQDADTTIAGALHYLAQSLKAMEQRQAHTELVLSEGLPGYTRPKVDTVANARHDPCVVPRSA